MPYPGRVVSILCILMLPQLSACDSSGRGLLGFTSETSHCHPWPSCTAWTRSDTLHQSGAEPDSAPPPDSTADQVIARLSLELLESASLELTGGQVYRVEIEPAEADLDIEATDRGLAPVILGSSGLGASASRAIELWPRADGAYRFTSRGTGQVALIVTQRRRGRALWQPILTAPAPAVH